MPCRCAKCHVQLDVTKAIDPLEGTDVFLCEPCGESLALFVNRGAENN